MGSVRRVDRRHADEERHRASSNRGQAQPGPRQPPPCQPPPRQPQPPPCHPPPCHPPPPPCQAAWATGADRIIPDSAAATANSLRDRKDRMASDSRPAFRLHPDHGEVMTMRMAARSLRRLKPWWFGRRARVRLQPHGFPISDGTAPPRHRSPCRPRPVAARINALTQQSLAQFRQRAEAHVDRQRAAGRAARRSRCRVRHPWCGR